jgi:thiol:disulfide interchange protein
MKRIIVLSFCLLSVMVHAQQNADPIKWSFALSSKEIHIGDTVEIVASATIIPDWYLYSNDFDKNLGPTLTQFEFDEQIGYRLLGTPKAINPKKKYDKVWEGNVTYFVGHAEFKQKIIITAAQPKISFTVNYQTCSDAAGRCIPGDVDFEFFNLNILSARKKGVVQPKQKEVGTSTKATSTDHESKTEKKSSANLENLESTKEQFIHRDAEGNDMSTVYLKSFVKKYSK